MVGVGVAGMERNSCFCIFVFGIKGAQPLFEEVPNELVKFTVDGAWLAEQ